MVWKLALVVLLAVATWLAASGEARAWWRARYRYNGFTGFRGYGGAYHNPYTGGFYRGGTAYNPYTGRDVHMQRSYNPYTNTYSRSASFHNPYTGRYGYRYGYAY